MALYFRMAITMIVSFFAVRVTLQILGSEDYGLNNLVGSVVALFSFINSSMGTAVQRYYSYEIGKNNEQRLYQVFGVSMYLHICVAIVTLLLGEGFAVFFLHYLNIPQERMFAAHVVFQISLMTLILNIINVPYAALLRAREDFDKFAVLDIIQALSRLVILFFLYIIAFDKLITLSLLNFIISTLYVISVYILAIKYPEASFHINRNKHLVKEMTGFISMLLFTVLFSLLRDKGIVVLINLFFGLALNTAYAIASQIMHLANAFAMNFKQAMVPQIVAAYSAGDIIRMNQLIYSGTKITFILLLLITAPIITEPHYVLDIILKDVPEYASQFTMLVLINVNVSSFTYFIYQCVHGTGKIKKQQTYMSALYFMNVLLIYILFKLGYNSFTAIYATIFCSTLQCLVNIHVAKETFNLEVKRFISISMKCLFVCVLVFLFPLLTMNLNESFVRFCLNTIGLYTILIGSSFFFLLNHQEKTYLKEIIANYYRKITIRN